MLLSSTLQNENVLPGGSTDSREALGHKPLLQRYLCPHIHCSSLHHGYKQKYLVPISRRLDKENVVPIVNGILLSCEKNEMFNEKPEIIRLCKKGRLRKTNTAVCLAGKLDLNVYVYIHTDIDTHKRIYVHAHIVIHTLID